MFYPNNRLLPLRILSYRESTVAAPVTYYFSSYIYAIYIYIYMLYIYICYIYIYIYIYFSPDFQWSIPENIQIDEGWGGHGSSRIIKKIECGNSRSQLKKKWNFKGWSRKYYVEFPWVLVLGFWPEIPMDVTQSCRISRGEVLFCLEFPRVKW